MQALDQLNGKLNTLLKKYAALEAENKRLTYPIAPPIKAGQELTRPLDSLEHGMVSVHLGRPVDNESDKENMRQQLDNVITEIDRILNTLND